MDLSPPSDLQMNFSQSAPAFKHTYTSLDKPVDCPSTPVNKARSRSVFENNGKAL